MHLVWQGTDPDAFLDHITDELAHDFGIGHATVQLERAPCERADQSGMARQPTHKGEKK
ncbi:hypothetical protein [Methylacidimicrobium tartarophylax]|uniref:hypothetical protein n=1 Tax=Methylacidimicrobium tartarophylax TaxID=1041768 RepID=UPI001FECF20D|nr:hypothetical protein [Methylacidimicrobium tartarophylax]